jgi:hypothetical protein
MDRVLDRCCIALLGCCSCMRFGGDTEQSDVFGIRDEYVLLLSDATTPSDAPSSGSTTDTGTAHLSLLFNGVVST